jgi:hypothetical protein
MFEFVWSKVVFEVWYRLTSRDPGPFIIIIDV